MILIDRLQSESDFVLSAKEKALMPAAE